MRAESFIQNQVQIANDKSLPPLRGKRLGWGCAARKRGFGVPEFKRKPTSVSPLCGKAGSVARKRGVADETPALPARRKP